MRLLLVVMLVVGCHKKTDTPQTGSGSSGSALTAESGSAAAVPPAPATQDVGKALDTALAAKHVGPDVVKKRVSSASSAWAIVGGKVNDLKALLGIDVIASRGEGIAELHIEPPAGTSPGTIESIESLDAKDLDGDAADEGVLVVDWSRDTTIPGEQPHWGVSTTEHVRQLYVLAGAAPKLRVAFTHAVSYETSSTGFPEDNPTPYPDSESVTYDWTVAPGKPPTVTLKRTKSEVADKDRLKGVLNPVTDPLFAAGSGSAMPIVLK